MNEDNLRKAMADLDWYLSHPDDREKMRAHWQREYDRFEWLLDEVSLL